MICTYVYNICMYACMYDFKFVFTIHVSLCKFESNHVVDKLGNDSIGSKTYNPSVGYLKDIKRTDEDAIKILALRFLNFCGIKWEKKSVNPLDMRLCQPDNLMSDYWFYSQVYFNFCQVEM